MAESRGVVTAMSENTITAGGAIFARLKKLGIDYVFCNSGTDFPPIIEGLAEAAANNISLPIPVVVPHEHAAMGIAHGYYQATGKVQAVMLHTNVGLANGAIGAINAAHDNVPVIIMSGRTPATEFGHFGSRTVPIGWGQEMRDQTGLVREACKWDYELKFGDQIVDLLDRAYAIANSTPKGPVYLSLPREVLCEPIPENLLGTEPLLSASTPAARIKDIEKLAEMIVGAENPVIFSQRGTGSQWGFETLTQLVDEWAIPVNMYWAQCPAIPTGHPMCIGKDPDPWVGESDLVILIDALAPWMPGIHAPKKDTPIVNVGVDPLYTRTPVRNFRSELALPGKPDETIHALRQVLLPFLEQNLTKIGSRRNKIESYSSDLQDKVRLTAQSGNGSPMSKAWVAYCVSEAVKRANCKASVTSELGCPLSHMEIDHFNGYRQEPHSGGLGYGLPAALGIQLAEPDTLVFATMGDGSYIFSNPTACHMIAEAMELPVITCVLNNGEWGAVRHSVTGLYPDGYAAKSNEMPLTALQPSPDFTRTASASRAYVEKVRDGAELPLALDRAIAVSREERRQVLLDIQINSEPI